MFRGLKKAFSKGRSTEVEAVEGDHQQFDAPVVVRPKSKSVVATPAASDVTLEPVPGRLSPTQTVHLTGQAATASSAGKTAWSNGDFGENVMPVRFASKSVSSSPPATSTGILQQNNLAASATSSPPLAPASAGSAWGVAPGAPASPEKDPSRGGASMDRESPQPKHQSRMSFFRSGSKNARGSGANESTVVEFMGTTEGDVTAERDEVEVLRPRGSVAYGRCKESIVENVSFESAARGGALRAGALVATPQAL